MSCEARSIWAKKSEEFAFRMYRGGR